MSLRRRTAAACLVAVVAVVAVIAVAPAAAEARSPAIPARTVVWSVTSRFVDPNGPTPFNRPPGAPARPNALRVAVRLPAGYDGRRRFPVLWLLHGHGDAYDSWPNAQQGDLARTAPDFPGIIVMPDAAQGWYADWFGAPAGKAGWESYFLDELMPLVERRLRIMPGRAEHAIAGLSMGGEGAVYLAEQRPGYFGTVGTFSGTLSTERSEWPAAFATQGQDYRTVYGPPGGPYAAGHDPTALAAALRATRVFVSVGDGVPDPAGAGELTNVFGAAAEAELRLHAQDFLAALRHAGGDATYTPHQGIHAWPYWRQDLVRFLAWGAFEPVAERPASWTFATVRRHSSAWDLSLDFSAAPGAVERFVRAGDVLSATGDGTVTVTTATGDRFRAALPFRRRLPAPARARSRAHRRPGRRARRRSRGRSGDLPLAAARR